jgi:hypothetical protein
MSNDQDRVAVPTNGRRPHALTIEPEDTRSAASASGIKGTNEPHEPSATEMANAVSPRNLAIWFGILASLAVLVAGVLRRRADR